MVAQTDKPIPSPKDAIFAPGVLFYSVANGLANRGHEVIVYATKDSDKCGSRLEDLGVYSSHHQKLLTNAERMQRTGQTELFFISSAVEEFNTGKYDLIHFDGPGRASYFANFVDGPVTCIEHGAPDDQHDLKYDIDKVRQKKYFNNLNYIAISNRQRQLGSEFFNYKAVIYHGIDLKNFEFNPAPNDDLLFIGRIIEEKGVDIAIDVALESGRKLKIFGDNYGDKYWNKTILPKIDNKNITCSDHLPYDQVGRAYGQSRAMLMPIRWDEPFGMTVIESMACGTPVIAYDRGSMSELIVDGVTGFIIKHGDTKGLLSAINNIDKIDRKKCRDHVVKKFSLDRMVDEYEEFFKMIINQK